MILHAKCALAQGNHAKAEELSRSEGFFSGSSPELQREYNSVVAQLEKRRDQQVDDEEERRFREFYRSQQRKTAPRERVRQ
jgi:hypothetical protein